VNLDLIQSIRLVQALTESDLAIHIPHEERWRFARLRARFALDFSETPGPALTAPDIAIDHDTPLTTVGGISRPLIFPHGILAACRARWPRTRPIHVSFSGLITRRRQATIDTWLVRNAGGRRRRVPLSSSRRQRAIEALWSATGLRERRTFRIRGGDFVLSSSRAGRRFPEKAWDHPYIDTLAHSRFVLCPNGDSVWTYRFFEAAMCGAVPIIEEPCPLYEGFAYRTMADDDDTWSREMAEHNYALCAERLTVPRPELTQELRRLTAAVATADMA
jgi:hypothetical protein